MYDQFTVELHIRKLLDPGSELPDESLNPSEPCKSILNLTNVAAECVVSKMGCCKHDQ
jgi:hypothetical protein